MEPDYEIYAVRYGHHHRTAAGNFIGGDPHDGPMPLDYFVWAISGGGRRFLLDTGFDAAMGQARGRTLTRPVTDGLRTVGFDPELIEDVIVSHMHFDHCGNHPAFPRARYHVQGAELAYCTGRCMCHATLRAPFEAVDVQDMVGKLFAGRVSVLDGETEIAPGLSVHRIGGHSRGLQVVRAKTRRGPVVLASDASHFYANMETGRPFPIADSVADTVLGYETLRRLAASPEHVIPGHDPLVLARYPRASTDVPDIVRLDADPLASPR